MRLHSLTGNGIGFDPGGYVFDSHSMHFLLISELQQMMENEMEQRGGATSAGNIPQGSAFIYCIDVLF